MFWGSWSSGRGWRGGFSIFLGMMLIIGLMSLIGGGRGFTWIWWFILPTLIFSVLPSVIRSLNRNADIEKRKHDNDDLSMYEEKPKREPQYMLGDDGELIEVQPDDEKPKRVDYL